jgi:hypothetical protein
MAAADKPTIHLTLANLRKEIVTAEPLQMALSGSKIITFPDIYAMESVEAEGIFARINRGDATNWTVINKWLSKDDAAALKAEKLKLIELATVMRAAVRYYEDIYGTAGEGNASAS